MASVINSHFTKEDKEFLRNAIANAEDMTSGEIRLYIEDKCAGEPYERAVEVFYKLGMDKTAERNGVLFYIAFSDRKFAIAGDKGIHDIVGHDFWNEVKDICTSHFSRNEFVAGLSKGILLAGEKLKKHFPFRNDDVNELPDDIIINS